LTRSLQVFFLRKKLMFFGFFICAGHEPNIGCVIESQASKHSSRLTSKFWSDGKSKNVVNFIFSLFFLSPDLTRKACSCILKLHSLSNYGYIFLFLSSIIMSLLFIFCFFFLFYFFFFLPFLTCTCKESIFFYVRLFNIPPHIFTSN
jgi:hypothetical protein